MPLTTALGVPYPEATDNNNVPADLLALASWINSAMAGLTTVQINALTGTARWEGRRVWNSTTKEFWYWSGSAWEIDGFVRGEIRAWTGSNGAIPPGWLLANGQAVSRTTYANLFAVIGSQYGIGNGSTTFNVPNMNSRVPAGAEAANPIISDRGVTGFFQTGTSGLQYIGVNYIIKA
jgi:hypothetical protein